MDLRNNQISFGELLDNPKSYNVLKGHFGSLLTHPMLHMVRGYPLAKVLTKAGRKIPPQKIQQALKELREL